MSDLSSKLPLEVIELIIDRLADDKSFSSIKACSLVSRRLLPRTRTYLFSSIVFDPRYNLNICTSHYMFEDLISQTPEIAYYVTSLHFGMAEEDFENLGERCDNAGLARALTSLTRLKEITLDMDHALWADLTSIKEPILNLMHLPTLTHLKLKRIIGFDLSALTLCTGLKHLDIYSCTTVVGDPIEIYQETPSRLESFEGTTSPIDAGEPLLQLCTARRTDGKPIVDTSGLRRLCLDVESHRQDDLKALFNHLTQVINFKMLSCEALLLAYDFPDLFLPSLQTLQCIHLEISTKEIFPLVSGFASIAGKNVIQSIKLSVDILEVNWDGGDEWIALDQVFIHPELDWKKLRSFSLHIQVGNLSAYEMEDADNLWWQLQGLPETALKGLANHKNIMFDLQILLS